MKTIWHDVRYGLRMLRKSPGFSVVVVIILAIGIGASTVMLSVIDATMFRACPYKDPQSLVSLFETSHYVDSATGTPMVSQWNFISPAEFRDMQKQNTVFERLAGAQQWDGMVRTADRTEKCRGYFTSPEFFSILGVQPALGRAFLPEEYRQDAGHVAVLSYDHWRHWFAGDPNVIGQTLFVDRKPFTVVGVLPESFDWFYQSVACGLWMPMGSDRAEDINRKNHSMRVFGRLKSGVSLSQTQAEMDLIATRLTQAYPETNTGRGIRAVSINEAYARFSGLSGKPRILTIALAVVIAVLLIACLHVSSLLIARSTTREREIAVRAALGAHRLRLIRQLLTESILLALIGGLFGVILAYWSLNILSVLREQSIPWFLGPGSQRLIPWFVDIRIDARSLFYVIIISLLTCGAFGLLPAFGISKTNLNRSLSSGRTSGYLPRFHRLRGILVVLDIAVAFVLLIGAGLLINSYVRILNIDPKVDTKNVLTATLEVQGEEDRYSTPEQRFEFSRQLLGRIRNLPGVQSVAIANGTPAWKGWSAPKFTVEGQTEEIQIRCTPVSLDYFHLLRIPVMMGRQFTELDNKTSTPVAIINESLARRLWPSQNPLGKHLTQGEKKPITREVIGVTRDISHFGDFPDEEVFIPFLQTSGSLAIYPDMMIRTNSRTAGLTVAIRREILSVDPDILIRKISFLDRQIADLFSTERLTMLLLSIFAVVALALASIGIYGSMAYMVSRRTNELGIRIALGAQNRDIMKSILQQGLKLTVVGLTIGFVGAFATTRIVGSLLHDISPTDPLTFIGMSLLLTASALLASYIPARRAARIDPMEALRYE